MFECFNNNAGIGSFEEGAYDKEAMHPTDVNWTRQSRFHIPDLPKLGWKASMGDAFVNGTINCSS